MQLLLPSMTFFWVEAYFTDGKAVLISRESLLHTAVKSAAGPLPQFIIVTTITIQFIQRSVEEPLQLAS